MKIWKPILVLALVLVLGIVVYVKVYRVESGKKTTELQKGKLVQFDLNRITKFTLVRPDSSLSFERGTGVWKITAPVKGEASGKAIAGLFSILSGSDILYIVDEKPKDLAPYGLVNPQCFLAMEYTGGEPDTLFVGGATPDTTMVYVRFASEKRVLAVNRVLRMTFLRPLRAFRSNTIMNILPGDVQSIEIFRGRGASSRISMSFDGISWLMQSPWEYAGDPNNMADLLKQLSETTRRKIEAETVTPAELAKYGLDNPNYVINVSLKNDMGDKTLLVGNRLPGKRRSEWYAKQFDNDLVFTVGHAFIRTIDSKPVWFVDRQPAKFDRNVVNKIVLRSGKEELVFARDASNQWSAVSPVDKNVPEQTISAIFSITRFILVSDIIAVKPTKADLQRAGLAHPRFVVTIYSGNQTLAMFEYGGTITSSGTQTYVRTSLSPAVYVTGSPVDETMQDVFASVYGK